MELLISFPTISKIGSGYNISFKSYYFALRKLVLKLQLCDANKKKFFAKKKLDFTV